MAEDWLLGALERTRSNKVKALVVVGGHESTKRCFVAIVKETMAAGNVICDIVNDSVTKCDRRGSAK